MAAVSPALCCPVDGGILEHLLGTWLTTPSDDEIARVLEHPAEGSFAVKSLDGRIAALRSAGGEVGDCAAFGVSELWCPRCGATYVAQVRLWPSRSGPQAGPLGKLPESLTVS